MVLGHTKFANIDPVFEAKVLRDFTLRTLAKAHVLGREPFTPASRRVRQWKADGQLKSRQQENDKSGCRCHRERQHSRMVGDERGSRCRENALPQSTAMGKHCQRLKQRCLTSLPPARLLLLLPHVVLPHLSPRFPSLSNLQPLPKFLPSHG